MATAILTTELKLTFIAVRRIQFSSTEAIKSMTTLFEKDAGPTLLTYSLNTRLMT